MQVRKILLSPHLSQQEWRKIDHTIFALRHKTEQSWLCSVFVCANPPPPRTALLGSQSAYSIFARRTIIFTKHFFPFRQAYLRIGTPPSPRGIWIINHFYALPCFTLAIRKTAVLQQAAYAIFFYRDSKMNRTRLTCKSISAADMDMIIEASSAGKW